MNKAYLEITIKVRALDRVGAGAVYSKYKDRFLATVAGAESKELLLRDEDVQVLHGFDSRVSAENYLKSALFGNDVVRELRPYLAAEPEIRLYERQERGNPLRAVAVRSQRLALGGRTETAGEIPAWPP